jgi:rhizosphere induced protein
MIVDFSTAGETKYSLTCINNSATNWYFYLYQRITKDASEAIYSLAWMTSPYKMGPGTFITFAWSIQYSFFWFDTGPLQAGTIPLLGGSNAASLPSNNSTTFTIEDDTPGFTPPVAGEEPGKFYIMGGSTIPNLVFSTGMGLSGNAVFIQQALANTPQVFNTGMDSGTTTVSYGVAATTTKIQPMQVLVQGSIGNSTLFTFPVNTFTRTAVLAENNTWSIS